MKSRKKDAPYDVTDTQKLIVQRMTDLEACVQALTDINTLLRRAVTDCWHAANTYDGNYVKACDGVMCIAQGALKATDPDMPVKPVDASVHSQQVQDMLKVFENMQFKFK